jgi:3,4-dihydroxy-2-butanone 4-phosphate synthase
VSAEEWFQGRNSDVLTGEASVIDALRRIQRGEMVLVSDGPDREDEADLTMAAQWVTPEAIAFMLRHGRGLVCMPCDGARLDRLGIGAMVTDAGCDTAFTVTIDHSSVGSGISAVDRAISSDRAMCSRSGRATAASSSGRATPKRPSTWPAWPGWRPAPSSARS